MDRPQSPKPEEMMPRPAAVFLLVPVLAIVTVFLLYAYLFASGYVGRVASGATTAMTFRGCAEAADVVRARGEEMGLGAPQLARTDGGFTLTAVLPAEEDVAAAIPTTLATPGAFSLRGGSEVLVTSADVVSSGVRLDVTMTPTTLIVLTLDGARVVANHMNAHPDERMDFVLDGEVIHVESNRKPFSEAELEIPPSAEDDRARMALAAHRGIIIGHPHPCAVELVGTEIVVDAP